MPLHLLKRLMISQLGSQPPHYEGGFTSCHPEKLKGTTIKECWLAKPSIALHDRSVKSKHESETHSLLLTMLKCFLFFREHKFQVFKYEANRALIRLWMLMDRSWKTECDNGVNGNWVKNYTGTPGNRDWMTLQKGNNRGNREHVATHTGRIKRPVGIG